MPRLRPATSQTMNAEDTKKAAAIAAAAEAERLKKLAEENGDEEQDGEVEVEVDDEQEQEEENPAMVALKKQIDDLKKSEEVHRNLVLKANQEREDAIRKANEREITSVKETNQARLEAITGGIAAAQAEVVSATHELEAATQIGDIKAQAEAYRKIARAEANMARLEDGKVVAEEAAKAEPVIERRTDDPIEKMDAPQSIKNWLRAHPDYMTDPRKNTKLQALHWDVLDEGHSFGSPEYLESMEVHLKLREKPAAAGERAAERPAPKNNASIMSAPVSREAPNEGSGRPGSVIRLSAAQREAAKMAGISESEYAKQLQRIKKQAADGSYELQGDR